MHKRLGLGVAALCLCLLAADAAKNDFSKGTPPDDFKSYSDTDKRFTIQYPADWRVQTEKESVGFYAPQTQRTGGNLNLRWVSAPGVKVKDIVEPSINQLQKVMKNFKLETNEPAQFGPHEAHYLVYTADVSGSSVKLGQLFIGAEPTIYIVSFGSVPDGWDKTLPVAKQMIASFKPAAAK